MISNQNLSSHRRIEVANADVEGIQLMLAPRHTITGVFILSESRNRRRLKLQNRNIRNLHGDRGFVLRTAATTAVLGGNRKPSYSGRLSLLRIDFTPGILAKCGNSFCNPIAAGGAQAQPSATCSGWFGLSRFSPGFVMRVTAG